MAPRIIIVEDEMIVAANLEDVLTDLGTTVVGIAVDKASALRLAERGADIAFVDLNLQDGLTGPDIARHLSRVHGITVLFMTANPRLVASGVDGVLGVVAKPVSDETLPHIVDFTLKSRQGLLPGKSPYGVQVFAAAAANGR